MKNSRKGTRNPRFREEKTNSFFRRRLNPGPCTYDIEGERHVGDVDEAQEPVEGAGEENTETKVYIRDYSWSDPHLGGEIFCDILFRFKKLRFFTRSYLLINFNNLHKKILDTNLFSDISNNTKSSG